MSSIGGFFRGMFSGSQKSEPPAANELLLRAYGKLPFYAEYRRLEITPGAPMVFSQWMDAGRLAWCRSPTKSEQGVTRASRIVLRLHDTKDVIVANVWDSRDSAGRVFPFSFFVACPPEALGGDSIEQWVSARVIHQELDRCHAALAGFSRGGDFYKLYAKRYVAPRPADLGEQVGKLRQEAASLPAVDWFKAWSPDGKLEPAAWFSTLQRHAGNWRTQPDAGAALAVSCPLASGYSYPAQAVCWLSFFDGLVKKIAKPVTFIGPGSESPEGASLHFLLRDPKPDDFQLLCSDAGRYGFIENLGSVPASAAAAAPADATTPSPEPASVSLLEWMLRNASKPQ